MDSLSHRMQKYTLFSRIGNKRLYNQHNKESDPLDYKGAAVVS